MESLHQKIIRLREAGLSYERIAEEAPCAVSTVWYYLTPTAKVDRKKRSKAYQKSFVSKLKIRYGGKCSICKYDRCLEALDFHHTGHESKSNTVSHYAQKGKHLLARKEAEKCILVCSNCHRELHAGVTKVVDSVGFSPTT